jgi:DNA-binding response OmpR family regulator
MDLKMEDIDGLEATRRLAQNPVTAAIPVIAVTASALGNVRQHARDAGCVDYLSKPIRSQAVLAMLQTHLGVRFVSGSPHPAAGDAAAIDGDRGSAVAARLRNAVALGDVSEIHDLARRLLAGDPVEAAIGERINRLATNFDFIGLSDLADSLVM